jgi:outer membrane protein OmpA-like peptidoglycan-associated protein
MKKSMSYPMRIVKVVLLITLFGMVTSQMFAQVGMSSVPFLNIEPDARSSGLGFTGLTQVGGANVSYWNPALLAQQKHGIVSFSHANWLPNLGAGIYYDHVAASVNLGQNRGLALDLTYFNLGEQLARDDRGNDLGTFGNNEMAFRAAYGQQLGNHWSFGVAAQYFRSNLASGKVIDAESVNPGTGLALDFGGLYQREIGLWSDAQEWLRVGYNLASFGPGVTYTDGQEPHALPTKLRFGWSYEAARNTHYSHRFIVTNEFSKRLSRMETSVENGQTVHSAMNPFSALVKSWSPMDVDFGAESGRLSTIEQFGVGVGAEYWFNDLIAFRSGYFHENRFNGDRQLLTFGTGVRVNRFGIDFSYMNSLKKRHPLANTLKVTVMMNFELPQRAEPEPFVYQTPWYSPMDTVYVLLSKGFEPVQVPLTNSPAPMEYFVVNEGIASFEGDNGLRLNQVGTTDIRIVQRPVVPFTQGETGYVLVVLPDLIMPEWAPMDTVFVYLSKGLDQVRYPESDSPAVFTYVVEDTSIATAAPGNSIVLNKIGTTSVVLTQAAEGQYLEARNSYVLVVMPDPVFAFESVNFDFDKDLIREDDRAKLDHVIQVMNSYPAIRVRLDGHTDSYGKRTYNLDLSLRRARAVQTYLIDRGIDPSRIEIGAFAFDVPKVENNTTQNRYINRRVEIIQITID